MNTRSHFIRELSPVSRQRGIVLFVALIALVTMMLAAVALMRSVDTATVIAGNMAFKQSASNSASRGAESAVAWLTTAAAATLDVNNSTNAALGYYATNDGLGDLTAPGIWVNNSSAPATGVGIDASGMDSNTGNTTRYVIERMCNSTGTPSDTSCLLGAPAANTSSSGVKNVSNSGCPSCIPTNPSPMYRITIRVTGPQNTVSYNQVFIY